MFFLLIRVKKESKLVFPRHVETRKVRYSRYIPDIPFVNGRGCPRRLGSGRQKDGNKGILE